MRRIARQFGLVVALVAALTLSSCFLYRGDPGPVMLSQKDGQLQIAFCFSDEVRSVELIQIGVDQPREDYETVWIARGPRATEFGDIVTVSSDDQGFSSVEYLTDPTMVPDHNFQISVDAEGGPFSVVIEVPDDGLVEGVWVMQQKRTVDVVCQGYSPSAGAGHS